MPLWSLNLTIDFRFRSIKNGITAENGNGPVERISLSKYTQFHISLYDLWSRMLAHCCFVNGDSLLSPKCCQTSDILKEQVLVSLSLSVSLRTRRWSIFSLQPAKIPLFFHELGVEPIISEVSPFNTHTM